jgi:hypothetical protein
MKNIILQLITIFFVALIGCHIYKAYFGKTLEGMDSWSESPGAVEGNPLDKNFDSTLPPDLSPEQREKAKERYDMQIEVKQQEIFNKNNEAIISLTAFKDGLEKRISNLESKALQIVTQTEETTDALRKISAKMENSEKT